MKASLYFFAVALRSGQWGVLRSEKLRFLSLFTQRVVILTLILSVILFNACDGTIRIRASDELDIAVERVRTTLESQINKTVPSLSVLVQTPDGVYFSSSVASGVEPITPDTYFRFASNTKNFTATAILKMHQDGWLDYTDRITENIPGSDIPYVPETIAWQIPYKNQITIRHLLQHSAGVKDVSNDEEAVWNNMSYVQYKLMKDPNHQFSSEELVEQNVIHNFYYFSPGTDHHYSNTGYTVLSEIIARVYSYRSGVSKTYGDYMRDYIYGESTPVPLSIHFPSRADDRELPFPFVCGTIYTNDQEKVVLSCKDNMSAHVTEGNGYGTMRQINKYIRTLMKGANVLTADNVALMLTDIAPGKADYSLGCIHVENLGVGHNGATHGYLSLMLYDPGYDVSVVVMMPMWDESKVDFFMNCFNTLNYAGWAAREALGYPGKPVS